MEETILEKVTKKIKGVEITRNREPNNMAITRRTFVKKIGSTGVAFAVASPTFRFKLLKDYEFQSPFLQIKLNEQFPALQSLQLDAFGKNKFRSCPLLNLKTDKLGNYEIQQSGKSVQYTLPNQNGKRILAWEISVENDSMILTSFACPDNQPFEMLIDQVGNHSTVLGLMKDKQQVEFPCLIHMPDIGTFLVSCDDVDTQLSYDARRGNDEPSVVKIAFLPADKEKITYHLKSTTICPPLKTDIEDVLYQGFHRNFINLFQVNPRLRVLANNSSSDAVPFTLYAYSELARKAPPFASGLTAMQLVGMTLDRYTHGMKGYGLVGYTDNYEGADTISWKSSYNSLDALPSLLIAACYYIGAEKNREWGKKNYQAVLDWANEIYDQDTGNTGLIKHPESGNSGSWKGTGDQRPANWWDTIGFGHEDAYSNALAYRGFVLFSEVSKSLGKKDESDKFSQKAKQLKEAYYPAFYNPETGVLAGWRSSDGQLHDYYFTFVAGVAITYGLVEGEKANNIMDKMLAKIKDVGYTDFSLGLPGNLIPVRREDYTDREHRWGGGEKEDGSDAFQIYENGGATSCFSYFTVKALQTLGRKEEANSILQPILLSISQGNFSGKCENGRSKDWKNWKGECWGYEGFLVDNYLVMLAAIDA